MTLKQLFYIFLTSSLIICFSNCNIYKEVNITKEFNNKLGKCYLSEITIDTLRGAYQTAFILEYHSPVFKTERTVLLKKDILKQLSKDSFTRIVVSVGCSKYLNKGDLLSKMHSYNKVKYPRQGFVFCLVEVPSRYKTYSFAELEKIAFTIEQKKVVKESYVSKEYVKKKPKELKENQYYYEAGYYSNLNEAVARHASGLSVSKIQEALNKKGYNLEVNNIMNDETKAALMDLQKKNGLPEGNLNMKTLRFLGLTL